MSRGELALVMSGGGARAAYQVGLLRVLAREFPDLSIPILTGVSAGAINVAFLASQAGSFAEKVEETVDLWRDIHFGQVFDVRGSHLARQVFRWGTALLAGGALRSRAPRGMVDATPLRRTLERLLGAVDGHLPGIEANIARGALRAVAITASSYSTGRSITWVEGEAEPWQRGNRASREARIGVDHVLASSALPLFFPAVAVGGGWYGDGGVRLTAPISPAIHLGADRILAISTRYRRTAVEADRPVVTGYPPPAQVAGQLLNAVFLDQFDDDALRIERINHLLGDRPEHGRLGLRTIDLLVLRPSVDLGALANDYEVRLPGAFRFLTRGLGTRDTRSNDLLSLILFQSDYVRRLIEIGEGDAEARLDEIRPFLEQGRSGTVAPSSSPSPGPDVGPGRV